MVAEQFSVHIKKRNKKKERTFGDVSVVCSQSNLLYEHIMDGSWVDLNA